MNHVELAGHDLGRLCVFIEKAIMFVFPSVFKRERKMEIWWALNAKYR